MLAGLIFATEDATDRPGALAATLPFGGMTLLEYQVRLLTGAGAETVMVAVARVTPALLAAVQRAGRRGAQVAVVRSAEEAAGRVRPGASLLVMADGLVTSDPVIDRMTGEGGEALLVTDDAASPAAIERLDMRDCWAGIAKLDARHLATIARMPDDWDFQSALLRVAVEAKATHVPVSHGSLRGGHAVVRSGAALASRSNAVLAALTERRTSWADRWVFTRIARLALPRLAARDIGGLPVLGAGVVFGLGGVAAAAFDWTAPGVGAVLAAAALLATASAMAVLRREERRAALAEGLIGLFVAALLLVGAWRATGGWASATPAVLALVTIAAQIVAERAPSRPARWWSSPSGLLLLFAPFGFAGQVLAGLAAAALYAFATLAAAVEATREKA